MTQTTTCCLSAWAAQSVLDQDQMHQKSYTGDSSRLNLPACLVHTLKAPEAANSKLCIPRHQLQSTKVTHRVSVIAYKHMAYIEAQASHVQGPSHTVLQWLP